MSKGLVLLIYNLVLPFALLAALPGQLIKMVRRGSYGRNFMQRFGLYSKEVRERLRKSDDAIVLWVHAVSVGEMFLARKVIDELRRERPQWRIVLSTTTSTGFALASRLMKDEVTLIYNPLDLPWAVRGALKRIQPDALLLMEAEVWPNLICKAKAAGAPAFLLNARLSPRSQARYRRFRALTAPVFRELEAVLVQYPEDIARWTGLGVDPERVFLMGSIKFDVEAAGDPDMVKTVRSLLATVTGGKTGRVLLAGSTHAGEEKLMGKVFLKLRETVPDLFLVTVPRHFERAGDAMADLRALGLEPVTRSSLGEDQNTTDGDGSNGAAMLGLRETGPGNRCLVVDSTGELAAWICLADLVVMGKSFYKAGGQNPAEAIAAGKPVFFGPHMENFEALVDELREAGGAVQVRDGNELALRLAECLENTSAGEAMAHAAKGVLESHRGATRRTVEFVRGRIEGG